MDYYKEERAKKLQSITFLRHSKVMMVTYCISQECVAVLLSENEPVDIREAVSACLISAGCRPWQDMEAEVYEFHDRCLLIARPRPPRRERLSGSFPRLRRS